MTTLSHLDPNFGSVFSIEAVNEPIMNATQTPNYGTCVYHPSVSIRTLTRISSCSPEELCGDSACGRVHPRNIRTINAIRCVCIFLEQLYCSVERGILGNHLHDRGTGSTCRRCSDPSGDWSAIRLANCTRGIIVQEAVPHPIDHEVSLV